MNDAQLRSFAMETTEVRYPEDDWLHVFTDGSILDRTHWAGAGTHCELFNFYLLTVPCTTGEIKVIAVVVQQLLTHAHFFEKIIIFIRF